MSEVYLPWALFVVASALANLFLQNLPMALQLRRIGRPGLDGRLWVLGVVAVLGLCVWPWVAAAQIDWPRREPSLFQLVTMTFAAVAFALLVSWIVGRIAGAYAHSLSGLGPDGDATAADLGMLQFLRRYRSVVFVALLAFTAAAYGVLVAWPADFVGCWQYGYCYS